jgi:hypothetical protein
MKRFGLILWLVTLAITIDVCPIVAATVVGEFVRKPGQYSLDAGGSTLTITTEAEGTWKLTAEWRYENGSSSSTPNNCLRSNGWFVFVEKPGRIWVFDGVDGGVLLLHDDKSTTAKHFSRDLMAACPRKVWDALPRAVREKYPRK